MPWEPGQRVGIGMAEWAPFGTACGVSEPTLAKSLTCPRPGISSEVLAYLLAKNDIDYELVPYPNPDWGTLINDTCDWSGILGDIYNGSIHTVHTRAISLLCICSCLLVHVCLFRISRQEVLVFKREEDIGRNVYSLFRVFTPITWLIVFFITLLLGVVLAINNKFFAHYYDRHSSYRQHLGFAFWHVVMVILHQSTHEDQFPQIALASRWIFCLLGIFAMSLLRLYEGSLLASLFVPPASIPFTNLDELAAAVQSGQARYILEEGTSSIAELLNPNSTYYPPRLRGPLMSRPLVTASTIHGGLEMVRNGKAGTLGFTTTWSAARMELASDCALDCRFLHELPPAFSGFVFAKEEKWLVEMVSGAVDASYSHGEFLQRRYYGGSERPTECRFNGATLSLHNLLGAFAVFGVLAAVGMIVFVCELCRC